MFCTADPKEIKRQRERERYSETMDDINKRRCEAYRQKKPAAAHLNDLQNGTQTPLAVSNGKDNQILLTCLTWIVI